MNKFSMLLSSIIMVLVSTMAIAAGELVPIKDKNSSDKPDCSAIFKVFGEGDKGYRKASLRYHPDKCSKDECIEKFHEIKKCYGKGNDNTSAPIVSGPDTSLAKKLIALVKPHEGAFCRSGATMFDTVIKSSIRVKEGAYCKTPLNAALANAVCIGLKNNDLDLKHNDNYLSSHCFNQAQNALGLTEDTVELPEYYVNLLSEKLKSANMNNLCSLLSNVIGQPFDLSACKKIK